MYDLVIIGSGPAGLAAAIYARRACLRCITLEKEMMSGGQVVNTNEVDNYPGLPAINGFDLAMRLREHAESLGAEFAEDCVTEIRDLEGQIKTVCGENRNYETRAVLVAAGAGHRKLMVPGEEEFAGRGVSYCAVCDGAFYRDRVTAVVGGGDAAVEDAIFLSRMCRKVYLVHRRESLRAAAALREQLAARDNVKILWNTVVKGIEGGENVERLLLAPAKAEEDGQEHSLPVDGLFVAVGTSPNSGPFSGIPRDEAGYLVADESGCTGVPGVFAAGDIRTKALRQIVTAVSDGANAVTSAERYLASLS